MKQKILALVAATVAVAGLATSGVNAAPPATEVTGVITESSVAVANASVAVLCNGHTETDTTDAYGSYRVLFASSDCPFGSTVKVTAQKSGKSGVASGTVQGITTKLNLAIVNVSIPEYGLIGAALAGSAGVGMIAYTRRRQTGDSRL
jgi:hypothetical protein